MTNKYKKQLIEKKGKKWVIHTHNNNKYCDNLHKAILYLRSD